ncbi:hypothetical protein MNEG_11726 [Monoraphidium neglectum]|jgi:hypothetical protein|uniref:Uncharacterized protein n=1 Tax=Monoraphidium neglectum TaxID=145388 RepID=A0A0D2MNE6_9CHLO|nr:hypothetical protein MNEG_11726 [Monoraphidium neglectum]KIY96235.1 hypothetical protein MNEG_11726 [Monoraphidium neglectum]|eukprot:XP_013895255.1 hypothetical protein MNEG_11726 [Monoraphidium neglectum]
MADFAQVGQLLDDAIDYRVAQAVQQHVQPAVQQAVTAQLGTIVQAALQPIHRTLTQLQHDVAGLQQNMAGLQQSLSGLRQDVQTLGARQRNGVCCSSVLLGAVPIQWPHHGGGAMPAHIAGQPLPATGDEVQEATAPVVDGMLSLYGLPAGSSAGGLPQRRTALLAHAGIYV